jgi:hypothetical protein
MKNFSTANLIGRVIGAKVYGVDAQAVLPRSMALPMAWLYKLPDEKIAQLLVEAMADPILYRDLVRKATEITVVPLNKRLKAKAVESGIVTPQSLLASEE